MNRRLSLLVVTVLTAGHASSSSSCDSDMGAMNDVGCSESDSADCESECASGSWCAALCGTGCDGGTGAICAFSVLCSIDYVCTAISEGTYDLDSRGQFWDDASAPSGSLARAQGGMVNNATRRDAPTTIEGVATVVDAAAVDGVSATAQTCDDVAYCAECSACRPCASTHEAYFETAVQQDAASHALGAAPVVMRELNMIETICADGYWDDSATARYFARRRSAKRWSFIQNGGPAGALETTTTVAAPLAIVVLALAGVALRRRAVVQRAEHGFVELSIYEPIR